MIVGRFLYSIYTHVATKHIAYCKEFKFYQEDILESRRISLGLAS